MVSGLLWLGIEFVLLIRAFWVLSCFRLIWHRSCIGFVGQCFYFGQVGDVVRFLLEDYEFIILIHRQARS